MNLESVILKLKVYSQLDEGHKITVPIKLDLLNMAKTLENTCMTKQICGTCIDWQTCRDTEGWRINSPCSGVAGVYWRPKK